MQSLIRFYSCANSVLHDIRLHCHHYGLQCRGAQESLSCRCIAHCKHLVQAQDALIVRPQVEPAAVEAAAKRALRAELRASTSAATAAAAGERPSGIRIPPPHALARILSSPDGPRRRPLSSEALLGCSPLERLLHNSIPNISRCAASSSLVEAWLVLG